MPLQGRTPYPDIDPPSIATTRAGHSLDVDRVELALLADDTERVSPDEFLGDTFVGHTGSTVIGVVDGENGTVTAGIAPVGISEQKGAPTSLARR